MPKIRLSAQLTMKVLQLIRTRGSIAKSDVTEETDNSPFVISKVCDELLEGRFITEAGLGDSTGGRRPTLLSLTPGFGRLIGVHMGTLNLRIVMTDFSGKVLDYAKDRSLAEKGPEVSIDHLTNLIDEMLKRHNLTFAQLNGIGLGISGVLERSTGVTLFWPKQPLWVNVPVKRLLQEHYGDIIVELEDTSRTHALAEFHFGKANQAKHFVFIGIGAGTGAALFLNGGLYGGIGGFAGEFGHISVAERGPLCSCGNRGCMETMVSASAVIRRARKGLSLGLSNVLMRLSREAHQDISIEMLAQAARAGDRFSLGLLAETGAYLGRGIVGLVNLLNPELIVIGGGIASAVGELILPEIERVVRETAMIQSANQVRLQLSQLEEKDWARGATLLVAEEGLNRAFLKWKARHARSR
jgi:N-acetylglucosamine repressor